MATPCWPPLADTPHHHNPWHISSLIAGCQPKALRESRQEGEQQSLLLFNPSLLTHCESLPAQYRMPTQARQESQQEGEQQSLVQELTPPPHPVQAQRPLQRSPQLLRLAQWRGATARKVLSRMCLPAWPRRSSRRTRKCSMPRSQGAQVGEG